MDRIWIEYGQNMDRIWTEYGENMDRIWIEYGWERITDGKIWTET